MAKEVHSRFEQRSKRRKINRTLNIALAIVFVLIIAFGWPLLFSNKSEHEEASVHKEKITKHKETDEDKVEVEMGEKEKQATETEEEEKTEEPAQQVIETAGDPSSDVLKEIVNPSWQPVGTTQTEPHVTQFDEQSVDWKEMLDAVSYATGLSQTDMIVWFIGNNGPNKAVATVSPKDKSVKYRVYIEWVENQGWKPTKVQQLKK
ncbi:YrrS family protein [Anoxybacteroides tepidamans]|uniref:YrrS family protein n=1 Tax=Anoxybacteroides tepidamans TaxID=265948 RepID=UPI0005595413|nr:YrrS family protein [Anoxybacillus tepidamans]